MSANANASESVYYDRCVLLRCDTISCHGNVLV